MSVDFDRSNFEFNEEFDNEAETTDTEPVEPVEPPNNGEDAEAPEEARSGGLNPVRIIILVLILLLLLCAVCFLGSRVLPDEIVGQLPPIFGAPTATQVPAPSTMAPTDEAPLPTTEAPTDEAPVPTEEPMEPTEEPTLVIVPSVEPTVIIEPTGEGEETPEATATTAPVPGPTATTGPTVVVTISTCDNNVPPEADANGPYDAMRGKGQAIVTFDGTNSSDQDGEIVSYEWDFGDGSDPKSGEAVTHGYTSTGSFVATLKVTDNCGDSDDDTADVNIVGPTPPANGSPTPDAGSPTPGEGTPTPPAGSASGTVGWCYRVQYGDTLTGIAHRFGVSVRDLSFVNGVNMNYFVIAGQGLFVPTGEITDEGPNVYEVQSGDTMNSVAFQCGLTSASLASANGLGLDDSLTPGRMLLIPPWVYR